MRRAAQDMGVSHTVVSRHVRNLERWLGRKLVRMTRAGAKLMAEGESFLASDELTSGRLIELFDTIVELGTYYLLTAPKRSGDPLIGVFKK